MPLVVAPARRGGSDPRFERSAYGGSVIYGMADGTVNTGEIAPDGIAMTKDGVPLFKTGPGSPFGEQIPVVKMPLKK